MMSPMNSSPQIHVCLAVWLSLATSLAFAQETRRYDDFDVVIAGGSTAAFAAAVGAAEAGARVALLEPTDWVGGQITSSGVPAIDEAWHKLNDESGTLLMDVAAVARSPANISPLLRDMLRDTGCPGNCWVSRFCFEPRRFLRDHLLPLEQSLETLTVFRETVVKRATTAGGRITELTAIKRTPRTGLPQRGYDHLPSQDLADWYSATDSDRFTKELLVFAAGPQTQFIDATEWGELLVLADAPYLIGVESTDGGRQGNQRVGQSITYGFVQELHATADSSRDQGVPDPEVDKLGLGDYGDRPNGWELVWTYRRLRTTAPNSRQIHNGDLCLQNWGYYVGRDVGGNDYPFGYLFLDADNARQQLADWRGGVDLAVMANAEARAFAWHHWFADHAPAEYGRDRISLAKNVLGTGHGLSKLPYIRDTRRSVGLDGFLLRVEDLVPTGPGQLARIWEDRIALGAYPVDIHPMAGVIYPDYIHREYDVAPFTIPFRALTNDRLGNLLVAGKTMAQSFLANSATRLHPTEWSTGIAAGVSAAMMAEREMTSRDLLKSITELQSRVRKATPIDWTMK